MSEAFRLAKQYPHLVAERLAAGRSRLRAERAGAWDLAADLADSERLAALRVDACHREVTRLAGTVPPA